MNYRSEIKLIAFDLDGTIYNGNQIIEGASDAITFFRNSGKHIRFFTNNSASSRRQIYSKLLNLNIELIENEVYCCTYAAAIYLKHERMFNLHVVGSETLKSELTREGFNINTQSSGIDAMLVGIDPDFNYNKLNAAFEIIQNNKDCKIIVSNTDNSFPSENGLRKPGCGAIVASLLSTFERNYDFMLGKPSTYILDIISKETAIDPEGILVVGDSYHSDIQMAKSGGAKSVFICGKTDRKFTDTIAIEKIKDIKEIFTKYFT